MRLRRRSDEEEPEVTTKIVVDGAGELSVKVMDVKAAGVELEVIPPSMAAVVGGRHAQFIAADATRTAGHLERLAESGRVRFVRDKSTAVLREWTRIDVDLDALCIPNDQAVTIPVKIKDLSAGGALLSEADALPLGMRLDIVLPLTFADEVKIRLPARIIRAQDGGIRALRFMEVDEEERKIIQAWVLAQQISAKRADELV